MLDARPNPARLDQLTLKFLSFGRVLDPAGRKRKLSAGLRAAKRQGADHIVISGDLTEVGSDAQFEAFAETLHETQVSPDEITLVPGNHDAYTSGDAWRRALAGPLRAFAATSAEEAGKVLDRGNVAILPLNVSFHQSIAWSAGDFTPDAATALAGRLADPALSRKNVIVVQHHPPFGHAGRVWQWVDGLRGHARLLELLVSHPRVQLLHGHLHRMVDRIVGLGRSRIFGASATVDDPIDTPRVRLYEVTSDGLRPVAA